MVFFCALDAVTEHQKLQVVEAIAADGKRWNIAYFPTADMFDRADGWATTIEIFKKRLSWQMARSH